jgi:hypothetical protein
MVEAKKLPSPFVRYRCSRCNCWICEDAVVCRCGALFECRYDIRHATEGERYRGHEEVPPTPSFCVLGQQEAP